MIDHITILIPLVAFWFSNITGVPQKIVLTNKKPFTCSKCMALRLALAYQIYSGWFGLNSILIICLSSYAAYLIEQGHVKFKLPINA